LKQEKKRGKIHSGKEIPADTSRPGGRNTLIAACDSWKKMPEKYEFSAAYTGNISQNTFFNK